MSQAGRTDVCSHLLPATKARSVGSSTLGFWRIYLYLHLVAVMASAYVLIDDTREFLAPAAQSLWPETAAFLAYPIASLGLVMLLVSPVILATLLCLAFVRDARYLIPAVAEVVLVAAHFFALVPTVQ